jgi:ATP-dependent helicase/nuclease subunit A
MSNFSEFFYYLATKIIKKRSKEDDYLVVSLMNEVIKFSRNKSNDMRQFLDYVKENDIQVSATNIKGDGVRISTIHGAKGLESQTVCLLDFKLSSDRAKMKFVLSDDGVFFVKPKQSDLFAEMEPLLNSEYRAEEQETLRLLYVALTRARDGLHVFGSKCDRGIYELVSRSRGV